MTARLLGCAVALLLGAGTARAQDEPVGFEGGLEAMLATARSTLFAGGPAVAWRPGERVRVGLAVLPGVGDGDAVMRGELTLHFMLSPARRHGVGVYGIGGLAGVAGDGNAGYLMLGAGMESSPGGASGWQLEAGVGGGFRLALGWRRRWVSLGPRS